MDKRSSSSDQSEYEARDIRPEVSNDESADHSNVQHVLPVAPRDSHSSASVLNKDTSIHTLNLTTSAHAASFLGSWITPFRDDYVFDHLGESPPGFQSKADEPEKSTHTDLALDGSDVPQARSHTSDVSLLGITPELEFGNEATAEGSEETKQTGISNALKILELPRHPRRRGRPRNKKVYHATQKTGCDTCRLMKKKCDETKPICKVCERNNVYCGGYEQKQTWPRNNQGKRSLVVHNDAEPSLTDERGSVAIRDDLASASAICELCIKDISNYLEQLPQGEGSSFVIQQPTATPNDVISAYENELKDGRARLKLLLQDLDSISKSLFFGKRPNAQRIMQGLLADLNDLMITFWRGRWPFKKKFEKT